MKKNRKNSYYLLIGIIGILAVTLGFFTTYIRPTIKGELSVSIIVHIHGALAFGWIVLFLLQTLTVKFRKFQTHRKLGYLGLFLAVGIIGTMLPTAVFQVNRDLARSGDESAISSILGVITTAIMFGILVGAGIAYRKKPKIHKRLLLLATIVLLWPAWFRFRHYFPSVERPEIWFGVVLADSLILFSWLADRITYGKIHPVLLYGGLLIMAEHAIEIILFDSGPWRAVSKFIYEFIT